MKAITGQVAVAAARDLAVVVPRELAAGIERRAADGGTLERFKAVRARMLETVGEDEATEAALADLLAEVVKDAARITGAFAAKIEGERRRAEGRAAGIMEALGVGSPEG